MRLQYLVGWGLNYNHPELIYRNLLMYRGFPESSLLGRNGDVLSNGRRLWDRIAVFAHGLQVQFDRATDQLGSFRERGPCSHAPGQVGHIGTVPGRRFFVDDRVSHRLSPACSRILRSVFGAVSPMGAPQW